MMTWGQAGEMAASGVSFGSHGATHRPLTTLSVQEIDGELQRSMERVRQEVGCDVVALSYPNGEHDTSVVERVRKAGIRMSFSTRTGTVSAGDDPFRLPRINVHQSASTAPLLIARIAGLF
jgi:peptidoglycan/xylan/chitin deacetylase (PgdA/CDA1 family)